MTQPVQISISHENCGRTIKSSSLSVKVAQFLELSFIILMPTFSVHRVSLPKNEVNTEEIKANNRWGRRNRRQKRETGEEEGKGKGKKYH